MTNFQSELTRIEQEFKAAFPDVNFASVVDRKKDNQIDDFINSKIEALIPENDNAQFYTDLFKSMAIYSPTIYSLGKAECVVSAVSYSNNYSINGSEQQLDLGVVGINKPFGGNYIISTDYFTGESLKVTEKSTAAEWQEYIIKSFAVCAKQFPIASSFDNEIEQFKAEIPGKILASLDTTVHTEL